MNEKRYKKILEDLLNIPSPSGYCDKVSAYLKKLFDNNGVTYKETRKGSLHVILEGKEEEVHVYASHIDTLGAMVKEIKSNGRLAIVPIGGFPFTNVEGENLLIHSEKGTFTGTLLPVKASVHIYNKEVLEIKREPENVEVRIDADTTSKSETLDLGIDVGDIISFETRTVFLQNGYIKSRYLDDKCCSALLAELVIALKEENIQPKKTIHVIFSDYEEVGHGIYNLSDKTTQIVSVDIGVVGGGQQSSEKAVSIFYKDGKTPYDPTLTNKMVEIARKNNLDYVKEVVTYYASDATAALSQGRDIAFGCIGPGVDATHHYERTHFLGIENTYKLVELMIRSQ